jgi:hypothetical protein
MTNSELLLLGIVTCPSTQRPEFMSMEFKPVHWKMTLTNKLVSNVCYVFATLLATVSWIQRVFVILTIHKDMVMSMDIGGPGVGKNILRCLLTTALLAASTDVWY